MCVCVFVVLYVTLLSRTRNWKSWQLDKVEKQTKQFRHPDRFGSKMNLLWHGNMWLSSPLPLLVCHFPIFCVERAPWLIYGYISHLSGFWMQITWHWDDLILILLQDHRPLSKVFLFVRSFRIIFLFHLKMSFTLCSSVYSLGIVHVSFHMVFEYHTQECTKLILLTEKKSKHWNVKISALHHAVDKTIKIFTKFLSCLCLWNTVINLS